MATGIYKGRLETDGNGNMLAYDPENPEIHGQPVAEHEGSYVFVQPGEPSHNDRHHKQFVMIDGTRTEDMIPEDMKRFINIEEFVNAGGGENMHHFEVQEDDPHYDENAPNNINIKQDPDVVAPLMTSHTEAWNTNE